MIGKALCTLGFHNHRLRNPPSEPPLWWEECRRCGHVPPRDQLEHNVYQRFYGDEQ